MLRGMADLTDDPSDPRLTHGSDDESVPQAEAYLVLSEEERAKEFVRPVRETYLHKICGRTTTMSRELAETYARDPKFYSSTYCVSCSKHRPVHEFVWAGTDEQVGT